MRDAKFLDGFPESFDNVIAPERMRGDDGSYVLPAVFPAHHPNAGNADPNAGQPDLFALAKGLQTEWARRIATGRIKPVPRGFAHEVNSGDDGSNSSDGDESTGDDDPDTVESVSKSKISKDFICAACGGRGHATA